MPSEPAAKKFIRKPNPKSPDPLVGLHFLTLDAEGYQERQGHVVAPVLPGVYLVELYSWMTGFPTEMRLLSIDDMRRAIFIDDDYDLETVWARYRRPPTDA